MANLRNQNQVDWLLKILDFGAADDGTTLLVCEFIRGTIETVGPNTLCELSYDGKILMELALSKDVLTPSRLLQRGHRIFVTSQRLPENFRKYLSVGLIIRPTALSNRL